MTNSKYWCVVPAAGIGSRMQQSIPKQYLHILNKTVIEWTLEALVSSKVFQHIVVSLNPNDTIFNTLTISNHPLVFTTIGGENRQDSVLNGLSSLKELGALGSDWVFVHDAARPCVSQKDLKSLIEHSKHNHTPALLGAPIVDSLKEIEGAKVISSIDRRKLWKAFTPQIAQFDLLKSCLSRALSGASYEKVTDEITALSLSGVECDIIEGSSTNIKITEPNDLELAEFYLSKRGYQ